jgi:hypothetical protein
VIADARGQTVRTLKAGKAAVAGMNRVWWDLRYDPTTEVKLRTSPLDAPEFRVGADGTRKFPTGGPLSVLVPPGTYTVKLIVAGHESSQPLTVRKDPNTTGSESDIQAQTKTMLDVRAQVNEVARLINQAESIRVQLGQLKAVAGAEDAKAIAPAIESLEQKLVAVESNLFNMTATGRGQDFLRTPNQMMEKLLHVADVVSLADFAPTDQATDVLDQLTKQLGEHRSKMKQIADTDVAAFNRTLRDRGLTGGVIVPQAR